MASMKLENLELWQELNEYELKVIQGGNGNKKLLLSDVNTEGWSIASLLRLDCYENSLMPHFC